jgi:hypothetical protein
MSWEVKYRCEFTDILGIDWTVDIEEDGTPEMEYMQATGDPLHIEWLTPSDDLLSDPIKGSMVTLNVECDTNFKYIDLYSSEDMVYKMKIYHGVTLYWQGWVSTDYTESYDTPSYTVSITAADGLGILKSIDYKDGGDYYTGRQQEYEIILTLLAKIGYDQFTEYCNIYEDRMDDDTTDTPMDQVYIENDVFKDMDCYSVLEEILKKYNAIIRQWNGDFVIYRPTELIGDIVYGRVITAVSVTGTSITPDQYLNREGLTDTDLHEFNGGMMMFKSPLNKFTADQDYGNRESWLDNYDFDISTWDDDTDTFDSWTHLGVQPLGYEIPGETKGIEIMADGTGYTYFCYQDCGEDFKACGDVFYLSFDYRMIKRLAGTANNVTIHVGVVIYTPDPGDIVYLQADGDGTASWTATPSALEIEIGDVEPGMTSWTTIQYIIDEGLPVEGVIRVILSSSDTAAVRVGYKDIRFRASSDELAVKTVKVDPTKEYRSRPILEMFAWFFGRHKKTIRKIIDKPEIVSRIYPGVNDPGQNDINAPEGEQSYILGDAEDTGITNVLLQFDGALGIELSGSLTQTATDFVNDFAADYASLTTPGVLLTSSGYILYFESDTPGTNFTGVTTIVNATGDLAGSVSTIQANSTGTKQKETLTFTAGSTGDFYIYFADINAIGSWDTDLETTLDNFVTDYAADFAAENVTLTNTATTLVFDETNAAGGFLRPTFLADPMSDYEATWSTTAPGHIAASGPVARIDRIILSGTSGTANITCHAETNTATFNTDTAMFHTISWHTRGNTETVPLTVLVADETASLFSKGRQFIQLPMYDGLDYETEPVLNLIGNIQDPINLNGLNDRVFVVNRAMLDVRNREWSADIMEIGEKTAPTGMSAGEIAIRAGGTYAWYDSSDLTTITKDGSNFVSLWKDKLLSGVDLIQGTGSYQPLWSADGILFDGVDNYLKTAEADYNQPELIFAVMKQVTWTANDRLWDGNAVDSGQLRQATATPRMYIIAPTTGVYTADLALDTLGIVRVLYNGASSRIQVNAGAPSLGDAGANDMDGFTLGCRGSVGQYGNIEVKEIVMRTSTTSEADIYAYLAAKHGI